MNDVAVTLVSLSSIVIAASAVMAVIELRRIREGIEELVYRNETTAPPPDDCGPGHAIFLCKDGQWVLAADMSGQGYKAAPPTMDPSYEGQLVKRASVRKSEQGAE